MSHSSSRIVVSILTLNSLLQIYENQPFEFNDSNLMMQHPSLASIFPTNKMINLAVGILILFLIDWKNKLNIISSLFFGISVIMQNFNYLLPKTLNIIQIYLQLLFIIKYIYQQTKKIYFRVKSLEKNNETATLISHYVQTKKKITKISKKAEKLKLKLENTTTNEIKAKIVQQQMSIEQTKEKDKQTQEQLNQFIPEQHVSEAELETENQCEINHSDLSQISQIKEEQSISLKYLELQIQLKLNGKNEQFCCNFDTFETISQILSSSFTDNQIIQIKIHILLNFYDENQDGNCRLWCIKKLLAFQF
ncbi:unnamed protein product (macronuclear) [Paramecium tetraurelia]|uniref:Transmembrane protein n=1 Tax=Paramecium tetraurelia TaxID=5888 RepID=A0DYE6_PARTE|nr:uncharacterized protein GSPATT00003031001 [Paramecium tetraurelia]CAK88063.1 unnamed protein product [Paramecium tetraurelia]|eukprot:XP_001455460.1 hypothetical protein (macronuclear) [Paramecium tetraurelia strain d4-2]